MLQCIKANPGGSDSAPLKKNVTPYAEQWRNTHLWHVEHSLCARPAPGSYAQRRISVSWRRSSHRDEVQLCERTGKISHKPLEQSTGQPQAKLSELPSRGSSFGCRGHDSAKTPNSSLVSRQQLVCEIRILNSPLCLSGILFNTVEFAKESVAAKH